MKEDTSSTKQLEEDISSLVGAESNQPGTTQEPEPESEPQGGGQNEDRK